MADADEVSHQQGHRGAAPPTRRAFLQRGFRVGQSLLLHDSLGEEDDFAVEQQEPGQPVQFDEPELFPEPLRHLPGHRAVAPLDGLVAQPVQVAVGGVSLGHFGFRQGVA